MLGHVDRRLEALAKQPSGLIPGLLFIAIASWWSVRDGGFDLLVWLPGSMILVSLAVVYVLTVPKVRGRGIAVAIVMLLAFTAWCFLTILWSSTPDLAWSGSNLTAVYLAVFVIFAWRPWPARLAAGLLGLFSISTALVGLVSFLRATAGTQAEFFIAGRLAAPISYSNANTALFMSAALPALFLASRREVHWLWRGTLLASVGVLAELALMCQSRATMVALPLTLLIFFAITPGRTRIVVQLVAVAAVVAAIGARPVLHVYEALVSETGIPSALADARTAIVISAVILFVLGVGFAMIDLRVVIPRRVSLGIGAAIVVVFLAGIGGGSVVFVDRYHPLENAGGWWQRFKGGSYLYEPGTPHLVSGFGSGRYDIWRVSFDMFGRRPLIGTGVDSFGVDYLRYRTRLQDPLYPHSIELRTLSGTGLIGSVLLLGFFASWAVLVVRRLRRGSEFSRGVVACAATVVAYWLIHGSVDWLWEIPILGAFAFACMALACRTGEPAPSEPTADRQETGPGSRRVVRATQLGAIALGLSALGSMALPWAAAREIDAAASGWRVEPQVAFARLDRAAALNPLSAQADIYAGVIAGKVGDAAREREAYERAIDRNPEDWYPYLALGALEAREGAVRVGRQRLAQARRLDPMEPVIIEVERRVLAGKPPSDAELDAMLVARVDLLRGKRQS